MAKIKNRRLFTSYISIIVIMSIVLFLFGFFGVFFISSNSLANSFKENFSVSIFFKEDAKKIEITLLQNELLMTDYIEKLKYVSKDDAILIMKEEYGQDFIKELGFNPLVNSIDFNLKSQYVESVILDSISEIISKNKYVDEIVYDNNLLKLINDNIKKITYWIIPSIIIFLLITFLLINSSIRLSIYSNRQLIKTMQLVGATKGFIRRPFIKTNIMLSLISSFISIALIVMIIYYIDSNISFIDNLNIQLIIALFLFIISLGFIISYISTFLATQNILKINADRLDI
ncbi:MAG: cell division protein FtsX [Flavobacteriaceae bacterium]|nr:cell division protein FtsX [Flavobacteriales bacterium]RCL69259.1 MAG: ABC transporter permease [Bacteroidota bacterium]|tara:strand:+ start:1436 stop:2299 length:864 start_codon:yes stop_codon:yes gene_type:complete